MHFFNQAPTDWFPKHQNQFESATYGSEFMTARQAIEQIIDLCYTLRMLGVSIIGPSWLFGDNKLVLTSSTIPILALINDGMRCHITRSEKLLQLILCFLNTSLQIKTQLIL